MGNVETRPSDREGIRITDSDSHRTASEDSVRITGRGAGSISGLIWRKSSHVTAWRWRDRRSRARRGRREAPERRGWWGLGRGAV